MTTYRVIHANPRYFVINPSSRDKTETSSSITITVPRVTSTGATRVTSTGATRVISRAITSLYPFVIQVGKRDFTLRVSKIEVQ